MTLWRNLVVALVAAFALAACSGSDSGPTQAELDAANAAQAAAEAAQAAAEAKAAAAEAAAEEAAAQARQETIAQLEKMAVMNAIAAAQASVAALMDDSSDTDVAGAMADIAAATAAIAAATSFSEADTAMYTSQVSMIETSLTTVQANIRAYRAEKAAEEAQQQATAADRAKMAVDDATADLNTATEAQGVAQTAYEAAVAAQAAAQEAVANATSETLADASAALAEALIASATAAAELAVQTNAVTNATAALMSARDTLAEVDPDHVALQAANAALAKAATDAQAQAAKIKALEDEIARLKQAAEDQQQAAMDQAAEEERMAMAVAGKALKGALGANPLGHLDRSTNVGGSVLAAATGLTVNQTQGALATDPAAVNLEAGDTAGSLGAWIGTNYALTNAGTGVSNSAVVYANQAAPEMYSIAARYATAANIPTSGGTYTPGTGGKGVLSLAATSADADIKADMFPTVGTKTFSPAEGATEILVPGTYHGASGTYRCTGTCTATMTDTGVSLSDAWEFAHGAGAMVAVADSTYLYFGWWLTKDKDGNPTAASAFHGEFGDVEGGTALPDITTIVGSATYTGKAAGKFAINDPLNGGDAGHFSADATLTAKFSGTGAGVTGTINNFMANDKAVPWSVALNNTTLAGDTLGAAPATNLAATGVITSTAADYTTATRGVDDRLTTVWSIGGTSAAPSGTWSGQMYDEALAPAAASDGSNVPTSVTGVFESHFGSTHTMVGGFGATR